MRIKVDSGQLDELEAEIDRLAKALDGDDTDELIRAAQGVVEEVEAILECAEDTSDWERKIELPDDDEEETQEDSDEEEEA